MTNSSNLSRNVMRRVRFVHAVRPFTSNAAGAIALLGISLYMLGREVFVAQVFRNVPAADLSSILRFAEAAFLNTTFAVQALVVLALLAGLWLARECARFMIPDQQRYT
ncbi:MAG: hypothetical protein QOE22_446 [Candidatus Parcubacteria bacterium]|jgi:hypothetical protein|nr:hypothetical protein [Candidatus Parcubacteria bacterium]